MEGKIATPQSVEIAKRLRSLRESVGLNPEQLSRAIYEKSGVKIGRNSIINYEVGESYNTKTDKNLGMRAEYVIALADFYGVSTDYLLGRTPDDVKTPDMDKRAVCDYTGLSEKAVSRLAAYAKGERPVFPPNAAPHMLEILNTILSSNIGESLILAMYSYLLGQYDAITIDEKNEQGEITCMSGGMAGLRDKRTGRNEDILSVLDVPSIYLFRIQEYLHTLRDQIQPPAMTIEFL